MPAKTFIDLINSVSYKINGKAADTNSRPTKFEIALALNDTEKMMVLDRPQYNFLRKTEQIELFKPGKGAITFFPGAGNAQPTVTGDSITVNSLPSTNFWSEGYTQGSVQPGTISNFIFNIYPQTNLGSLPMNGTFKAYLVAPAHFSPADASADPNLPDGCPDLNHILATSTTSVVVTNDIGTDGTNAYNLSGFTKIQFEFGDQYCMGLQEKVYMIVEFSGTAYNGRGFSTGTCLTATPSNDSWHWSDNQIPTRTYPGAIYPDLTTPLGSYFFWLTVNNAVYNYKNVSLPSDCRMPIRIGLPGSNFLFLPVDASQVMFKQFSAPISTFYETGLDADGNKTVTFNLQYDFNVQSQPTMLNYIPPSNPYLLCDYIASAGSMVNDSDVPIVPQDYVEALVYGAMVKLYSDNNGLPYKPSTYEAQYIYVVDKMNMIVLPQRSVAVSINTGSYTSTMAAVRGSTSSNSLYTAYWPNSWAHSYFAALGNGITSMG